MTCEKNKVESLVEWAAQHGLDFFEDAERVKALRTAPIECKDAAKAITFVFFI